MSNPIDGAEVWQDVEQNVHIYSNCMDGRRQSTRMNSDVELTQYHDGTSCKKFGVQLNKCKTTYNVQWLSSSSGI